MDFGLIAQILPFTVEAGCITIQLVVVSLFIGLPVAFIVAALRLSQSVLVWPIAAFYVSIMRGTPLLIQIFLTYFGAFGFEPTPFGAAAITMGFNIGAYMSVGIRGAVQSVDKGKYEAARDRALASCARYLILSYLKPQQL